MSEKRAAKRRKRRMNPLLVIVLGTSLMLAGSWSYQLFKIDRSIESKKAQLVKQKDQLVAQNDQLRQEIEKLNTPSYIEQLAREKLGLVRKGEILIAPKEQQKKN
ncbi:MAG: Cell division protein FtsL [Candidatus Dichloromethanomonas elyunquensis]|nr:MAG: Cell division protein FtsL [Candidatus Dichloromethanomonas elyunquensis]